MSGKCASGSVISNLGLEVVDVNGIGDYVGGLVGVNSDGSITSSFWETETSGQSISDGGTGLTTAEMQTINTFLNAGWDFANTWCMPPNDYPRLQWEGVQCD